MRRTAREQRLQDVYQFVSKYQPVSLGDVAYQFGLSKRSGYVRGILQDLENEGALKSELFMLDNGWNMRLWSVNHVK